MSAWDIFGGMSGEESVSVFGIELKPGSRVRLWPQRRADIFDMALEGKLARVASIERTVEGDVYLAVTVEEDPGADLGAARQVGHRFFFRTEEIEPVSEGGTAEAT
ncbi:MAG TPA: hypothetical protein VLN58_09110 [Verrucomicrobiae bacterium]|nr:hypothetical protein [Verrucomicrobiae bacterium]